MQDFRRYLWMNCELMMEVWPRVKTCLVITCGVDATLFLWYWTSRTLLWHRELLPVATCHLVISSFGVWMLV